MDRKSALIQNTYTKDFLPDVYFEEGKNTGYLLATIANATTHSLC